MINTPFFYSKIYFCLNYYLIIMICVIIKKNPTRRDFLLTQDIFSIMLIK